MASQVGKIETDVHLKASAEQFHDVYCSRTHHLSNIHPDKIHGVDILEGDCGTEGSIIFWNYLLDGKKCVEKVRIEGIDKENNKMTFNVLEGDLLKDYKSFKFILEVLPQENGSLAHWTLEYEKLKGHTPDPHSMMQLVHECSKETDAHLTQPEELGHLSSNETSQLVKTDIT